MAAEAYHLTRALRDPEQKELRLARIEELENQVFEKAAQVLSAGLDWAMVTHDQKEPPDDWIAEFGLEAARQRLKIAQSMWLPASVAPAGHKLALQAYTGISRGRNYRVKVTQNNLNVKIALPAPTTAEHPGPVVYEVRDLET